MSRKKFAELTERERAEYASRIKPLRQNANLTQAQLAEYAGVTRQTISSAEKGTTTPQADKLAAILAVLGIDVEEPEFSAQTELWLTMMGTIIETIPDERRQPSVNNAIRALSDGLRAPASNVIAFPGVGGASETVDLNTVDLSDEEVAASEDNTSIDPGKGEA